MSHSSAENGPAMAGPAGPVPVPMHRQQKYDARADIHAKGFWGQQ